MGCSGFESKGGRVGEDLSSLTTEGEGHFGEAEVVAREETDCEGAKRLAGQFFD